MKIRKARRCRNRSRITSAQRKHGRAVFDRLVSIFGTQAALCRALKIKRSTGTKYRARIPDGQVLAIERALLAHFGIADWSGPRAFAALHLRGVSRHDLRPDLYPRDAGYDQGVTSSAGIRIPPVGEQPALDQPVPPR